MAAYTIQEFINHAVAGDAISISATSPFNVIIDSYPYTIPTTAVDIGKYFSARQLLECYPIRAAIVGGTLLTSAGTTTLSITPGI